MDGINNAYALTSQIGNLSSLRTEALQDPKTIQYVLEQNFNKMLDDLISSVDSEDDEEEENSVSLDFLLASNPVYVEGLVNQQDLDTDLSSFLNLSGGADSYLNSLYSLQNDPLALQEFMGQI
jgi:hypothetical protein